MAKVSKTIHVRVETFDPLQGRMIPLPGVKLLIEHKGWLWDPNLSSGEDTTDHQGRALVEITYEEEDETRLNPYVTIKIPEDRRTVPAGAPADEQFELPDKWETRHAVRRRIPRIFDHQDPNNPLVVFAGLDARVRAAYADFHDSGKRNLMALPESTLRIHLADYDEFLWIDWLNPDDVMTGVGAVSRAAAPQVPRIIPMGEEENYPYFATWPLIKPAVSDPSETPRAWIDPPDFPLARLGGASFEQPGPLATDPHGFVLMIDQDVIRRCYPDGTLCETIAQWPVLGGTDQFSHPGGLALDQYRNLFVADTGNHRLVIFALEAADGQSGRYEHVRSVGTRGNGRLEFEGPHGLTVIPNRLVDGEELLAVADTGNRRVQVFSITIPAGDAIRTLKSLRPNLSWSAEFGAPESGSGAAATHPVAAAFWEPVALAADRQRRLFVCDRTWHRVSRWKPYGEFSRAEGIALDSEGSIFVVDSGNDRIWKFNNAGNVVIKWGTHGSGDGQYNYPVGVAIGSGNHLYITDQNNNRIQEFDGNGIFIRAWGEGPGSADGQFDQPSGIAVDAAGNVYVADQYNHRVQKFDNAGTFLAKWGAYGSGDGQFDQPSGIAVDTAGNVYVADQYNHRVQKFDNVGTFLAKWGAYGSGDGQFDQPSGIAVDAAGHIYITDRNNHRIQKFDGVGVFLAKWGARGKENGQFDQPSGIAINPTGHIYVVDRNNRRVQEFDNAGNFVAKWGWYVHEADWEKSGGLAGSGDREFDTPEALAVDAKSNYVYVAESGNKRVQRLEADSGNHLTHWENANTPALGSGFTPASISVDPRGELYVGDSGGKQVVRGTVFEPGGAPRADNATPTIVGTPWTSKAEAGHLANPSYVCFGPDGRLWVSDTDNDRVLLFERNAEGALVLAADRITAGLAKPVGLTMDTLGSVFVADSGHHRIRVYSAALNHLHDFGTGTPGAGDDEFNNPRGLAYTPRAVYVADRDNNRIKVLKPDGSVAHLTTGGGTNLSRPEDVAIDSQGNLYVADTGNRRLLKFDTADNFVREVPVSAYGLSLAEPCGVSVDDDDKLLVTDRVQKLVLRLETDDAVTSPGDVVLGYWDLMGLLRQDATGSVHKMYYPELADHLTFKAPARAVVDPQGLMAVADAGHHRIRLVNIYTGLHVNLFDLGEGLPDISFRASPEVSWSSLGLEIEVEGADIPDPDAATAPQDDFSLDHYVQRPVLAERNINGSTNALIVLRQLLRFLGHLTRTDEEEFRWGVSRERLREMTINLQIAGGSYHPWDDNEIYLGHPQTGRGVDAWDDDVVAHEMLHWVMENTYRPRIPFDRKGGTHYLNQIVQQNLAFNEGIADFFELFWGCCFGSADRVRGFPLRDGASLTHLTRRDSHGNVLSEHFLFGGSKTNPAPAWDSPNQGLRNEGYVANALWQIFQVIAGSGILFADAPDFWYPHNVVLNETQSSRFVNLIWKALRLFPEDPTDEQFQTGCEQYFKQLLAQVHAEHPEFSQIVQSIFELNNILMPVITITEGTSDTSPGAAIGDSIEVREGDTRNLIIRVTDARGRSLPGYNLHIDVDPGDPDHYGLRSGPGPRIRHGLRQPAVRYPKDLFRASNVNGIVNLSVSPAAGTAGQTETITISYQPDFDTDDTFSPPEKGDTREMTLIKLYLYELRAAAKHWAGTGNNLGAKVSKSLTVNILAS